jgi:hypothetical protein
MEGITMYAAILVKKDQDRRKVMRATALARRMVGMYRLVEEQSGDEEYNSIKEHVYNVLSDSSWRRFKSTVFTTLRKMLLNHDSMSKMLEINSKYNGTLKDMLWEKNNHLPIQAVSVRMGKIMEVAVKDFLCSEYVSYNKELDEGIKSFADYNIQRDLAVKKGNNITIAELKYNLNLDTEKAKSVVDKLDMLNIACKDTLKDKNYKTNVCMVSLRYPSVDDIPTLKPVLESVRSQYIVGYEQFFKFFGIKVTETMWKNLHKNIGKEISNYFENFIKEK